MKHTQIKKTLGAFCLGASSLFLSACSDSNDSQLSLINADRIAVIAGVSWDFSASEIVLAEAESPYRALDGYAPTAESDIYVATNANEFYRIGRYNIDNLTRYSFDTPQLDDWQFSLKDDPADPTSNAYELVFLNDQKAYLINYGIDRIWIVNPSVDANDEDNFKLGEIDISAYDGDSSPNAVAALIHDDVLYVVTQALQPDYSYGQPYLLAIDTTNDTEIDIDGNPMNGNGMPLSVQNPQELDLFGDNLYVTGLGAAWSVPNPYDGGVERVSTIDFTSTLLVDDTVDNASKVAIVSATKGYIAKQTGYQTVSLFDFNPTTGAVGANPLTTFDSVDIQSVEISPEGMVWVGIGDAEDPEIRILDPMDDSLVSTIPLQVNPKGIKFSVDRSSL